MATLPPVKKPLSALAQKSVTRPAPAPVGRTADRVGETETDKGNTKARAPAPARPAFEPVSLKRLPTKDPEAKEVPPVSRDTEIVRAAPEKPVSNEPQTFTLHGLSAMAGVLVAHLDDGAENIAQTPVPTTPKADATPSSSAEAKPSERATGPLSTPGSKLNLSV